jgi:hypothetical protein
MQVKAACCQLLRIQPCRLGEHSLPWRKLDTKPPFIFAPATGSRRVPPLLPPAIRSPRDRFDDKSRGAATMRPEHVSQQMAPRGILEFVDRISSEQGISIFWGRRLQPAYVTDTRPPCDSKTAIRPIRFRHCPCVPIDSLDARASSFECQRRSRTSGSASKVDDSLDVPRRIERSYDLADDEEVLRRVEKSERRAFAGGIERPSAREFLAALDVAGRKRSQRSCDFRWGEIGEVALLERREPVVEG